MKLVDLTGKKFGMLTVLRMVSKRVARHVKWECICDCGCKTEVTGNSLSAGATKSCGCLRKRTGEDHPLWTGKSITKAGYVRVSSTRGMEHREIIERVLGKPIPLHAVPHHCDENKANNVNSNLVLCENRAYHNLIHKRLRAYRESGNARWMKCCYCGKYDSPENLYVIPKKGGRTSARHTECHQGYMSEYHKRDAR